MVLVPKSKYDPTFEMIGVGKLFAQRKSNPDAVERIFFHYLPSLEEAICRKAKAAGLKLSLAEETELFFDLQPGLLSRIRELKSRVPVFAIKTEINRIAATAVNRLKREAVEGAEIERFIRVEELAGRNSDPFQEAYRKEVREGIERALGSLGQRQGEVLRLRFFKAEDPNFSVGKRANGRDQDKLSELTFREAGKLMGIGREAARQLEAGAKRRLKHYTRRKELERFLDD